MINILGFSLNYRPISLNFSISKVLEKCLKHRLLEFFNLNKFFAPNHYGFLKGKSTSDALCLSSNFVHDNLDKNEKVIGIFLDIKKAFDSVNHNILKEKLEFC